MNENEEEQTYGDEILRHLPALSADENPATIIAELQVRATILLAQEVRALNQSYSYFHA